MGVNKGTDNFLKFRDERLSTKLMLIQLTLDKQRRRRIYYLDMSSLVSYISEKTSIHRTTLMRNDIYKSALLNFLATQPGASNSVRDDDATPELLKAKLFDARLEIRNLRNQINILSKHIKKNGRDEGAVDGAAKKQRIEPDWYLAFSDTAMSLKLIIDRLNLDGETIQIDVDLKQIVDLSAPRTNRVLAGPERARWFIDYYERLLAQEKSIATSLML